MRFVPERSVECFGSPIVSDLIWSSAISGGALAPRCARVEGGRLARGSSLTTFETHRCAMLPQDEVRTRRSQLIGSGKSIHQGFRHPKKASDRGGCDGISVRQRGK